MNSLEDNTEMGLREVEWEVVHWIKLAPDTEKEELF
jgi:hypothetical protein